MEDTMVNTPDTSTSMEGTCDAAFEPLKEAFAENFRSRGDVGAAVSVVVGDRTVVDLWGGDAAPDRPWARDPMFTLCSAPRGPVAVAAHMRVDRALLDLEEPVATYWPEFAAA